MTKKNENCLQILAVDDDPSFLKILEEWFKFKECQIVITSDANAALNLLESRKFDTVLLDVMMSPVSGLEILRKIKENPKTKEVPVFMISQLGEEEHKKEAKRLGAVEYLLKTQFSLKELTEKIKNTIKHQKK